MFKKETDAIDAVYEKQAEKEEDELEQAIAASLKEEDLKKTTEASIHKSQINNSVDRASTIKRPDTNRPAGKAAAANTDRKNPLKNREPTHTARNKLTYARMEAFNIMASKEIEEKTRLESQLPPELNDANVEIIKREGDCFFISVTHQLRAYGFNVPDEYQTVRNLVADYIEKPEDITLDMIKFESPNYTTRKQYANALRQGLWGGKIEIIAIHDGCLSSLTDGQFLRINIYSVNNGQIELHPGFIGTRPDDEGEQLIERLPIRLLYVGNNHFHRNHFHRIYFDNIDNQKLDYHDEVRPAELILGQPIDPDTGITQAEKARQLEAYKHFQKDESASQLNCAECTFLNDAGTPNCAACKTALNKADSQINNELGMSEKEKEIRAQLQALEKYNNRYSYQPDLKKASKTHLKLPLISSVVDQITADEFGFTPRTAADQIKALRQFEEQHGPKFVNIVEDEKYLSLVAKCQADPFMIMGYQNNRINLHYESTWEKEEGKENTFIGRIYIPIDGDLNNRKYTRYPNPLMLNTDGKTIVNLSLHNWAFGMHYWKDKRKSSENEIYVNIKMSGTVGVSEVESTVEDADFFSISETQKSIQYIVHGSSYSPDTGVLALDDNDLNPSCSIIVRDPTDGRTLKLKLNFHRIEYMPPSDKVPVYDMFGAKVVPGKKTPGGKSRRTRKSRKQRRRRQTKRRQASW